jgi:hypothetical protein
MIDVLEAQKETGCEEDSLWQKIGTRFSNNSS